MDDADAQRSEARRRDRHVGCPAFGGDRPLGQRPDLGEPLSATRAHVQHAGRSCDLGLDDGPVVPRHAAHRHPIAEPGEVPTGRRMRGGLGEQVGGGAHGRNVRVCPLGRGIVPRVTTQPLWTPSSERIEASAMHRFRQRAGLHDATEFHRWSVEQPDAFWREAWNACGVVGARGDVAFDPGDGTIAGARFFPAASLNLAENLLGGPDDETTPAIAFEREDGLRRTITWGQLRMSVAATAASMRACGVQPGDRVAAWMPNLPETVIAFLAANAVGAIFSSTSADFGTAGVL
ncbi:MAG: hypothetical protein EHM63_03715, partial [Actinobacteria bacterium]